MALSCSGKIMALKEILRRARRTSPPKARRIAANIAKLPTLLNR
jgi:hypothetical protein